MKTAVEAHAEIEKFAKEKAVQEVRNIKAVEIGRVIRQGDIYIHAVAESHSHGERLRDRQLALGNTMGSRHVAEAPSTVHEGTTLPEWCDARSFLGPLIRSLKRFVISHPEHAHVSLPSGTYQVTHQMDARTLERVRD